MKPVKENSVTLQLEHLPAYASFLLTYEMKTFVETLISNCYEVEVPLLKFFETINADDFFKLSYESNTRLLTALKNSTLWEYIEVTKNNWITNQLPIISRDQVIVEDITLVSYARKKTFCHMVHHYTTDAQQIIKIIDEIDRFTLTLDSILFKTYLNIQEEKLKNANEELKKRERELLEAQSIGMIGSFEWDLTGNNRSSFTPEVFKIFELEETSNLEAFLKDVHPEDQLKLRTAIEKAMHDGIYECEYRYNRKNKPKVLYSRGKVVFNKGVPVKMVGTVADVTEKAQLILKLKESEELNKQAQALTNTGNWKWSIENDSIDWSDEMYRIYGLIPQSEKITFQRFLTFIHDEDRSRRLAEITQALKIGKSSDYIMRIVAADGKQKVLKGKSEVLLDKNKNPIGMLGTCQDITNEYYLTNELKKKNKELLRKNKDLESFNFIASHDLQEPLRKIQLYSNRIMNEGENAIPDHLLKYFEKIAQASNRMQQMIEDFLIFYQYMNTAEKPEPVDLTALLSEVINESNEIIQRKRADVIIDQLPSVIGIKLHLKQMLKHLLSNALKYSKKDEPPYIKITGNIQSTEGGASYLNLSISDNGIGFEQKYTDRIFELFQRLHSKDEYTGSGIGLSLCKKIAEDHGGFISVTSEVSKGSVFTVHLPH